MGWPKRFKNDRERQTERRVRYRALGLNTQGKPYGRHPNFVNHGEAPFWKRDQMKKAKAHHNARTLENYHRRGAANRAAGLTAHGRKPARKKPGAVGTAWNALRAALPGGVIVNWDFIPGPNER
jgi:hypothetical protein